MILKEEGNEVFFSLSHLEVRPPDFVETETETETRTSAEVLTSQFAMLERYAPGWLYPAQVGSVFSLACFPCLAFFVEFVVRRHETRDWG